MRKIVLDYGEGRDGEGIVHKADKPGLWMNAKCNNRRIGTNDEGIREYCEICFPEYAQNKRTTRIYAQPHAELTCEEIPENEPRRETPSKPKPKPEKVSLRSIHTVDKLLRKHEVTRRTLHNFNYYGTKLKDS